MNQSKYVKTLSKYEVRFIAKMRGINIKKPTSKIELYRIFLKKDKVRYKECSFKSIIADIINKLSKSGDKMIKKFFIMLKK